MLDSPTWAWIVKYIGKVGNWSFPDWTLTQLLGRDRAQQYNASSCRHADLPLNRVSLKSCTNSSYGVLPVLKGPHYKNSIWKLPEIRLRCFSIPPEWTSGKKPFHQRFASFVFNMRTQFQMKSLSLNFNSPLCVLTFAKEITKNCGLSRLLKYRTRAYGASNGQKWRYCSYLRQFAFQLAMWIKAASWLELATHQWLWLRSYLTSPYFVRSSDAQ